jgi:hypothetical protein
VFLSYPLRFLFRLEATKLKPLNQQIKDFLMKKAMILLFVLLSISWTSLEAQNFWCGGTPGHETDWNVAKNWSENRVPDWTKNVIIPDVSTCSGYYPVIDCEVEPIAHLEIQSNACLTILSKGRLIIDGDSTFDSGITLLGDLNVDGDLEIKNTALSAIDNLSGNPFYDQNMYTKLYGE